MSSSASDDEIWLYSVGVDKLMQHNGPISAQRIISVLPADMEFGTVLSPVTFCKKPAALARAFNSLLVLHEVNMIVTSNLNSEYDIGKLFFSSLGSVCTISDCILRKLRGFFMVISLDCTKLELLGEALDKSSSGKPKEKLSVSNRKKKGRNRNTKKQNPVSKTCTGDISHENPLKVLKFI